MLLGLAQRIIKIEVEELHEEVGGDEVGEVDIVILLVDLKQLVVLSRHDGKPLLTQPRHQTLVSIAELHGVVEIAHVHLVSSGGGEVLCQQHLFAGLQLLDEGLLLRCGLDGLGIDVAVVEVTPILFFATLQVEEVLAFCVEDIHQRVVPGRGPKDTTQVGILEGVSLAGVEGVAQDAHFVKIELLHVEREVNLLVQQLRVHMAVARQNNSPLLILTADGKGKKQEWQKNDFLHNLLVILEYTAQVGVVAEEFLRLAVVIDGRTLVLLEHGAFAKEELVEVHSGNDQPEDTEGTKLSFDVEAVVDVHRREERVVIEGERVVLVEHMQVLGMGEDRVGMGKHVTGIFHHSLRPVS